MRNPIVNRRVVRTGPPRPPSYNLAEFAEKRKRILVQRNYGGLGDILVHRMLFEDMKLLMPDAEIHFACPWKYLDAVSDHPYIDRAVDVYKMKHDPYMVVYNTSTACARYELRVAPHADLHRADIWASHCGLELTRHDMHIHMSDRELEEGRNLIESVRDRAGPVVIFTPISAMVGKNLNETQQEFVVKTLRDKGLCVIGLHEDPIAELVRLGIPVLHSTTVRKWMSVIACCDYVVSVDTAAFHCAGGMGKPLLGVFTFVDGKVYSRYYPKSVTVQKHRDDDPDWRCGPCYNWVYCPKSDAPVKPCLTEITHGMLARGIDKMLELK